MWKPTKNALTSYIMPQNGNLHVVKSLLHHKVSIETRDDNNRNILHYPSQFGDGRVFSYLFDHFPTEMSDMVNSPDNNGNTPLQQLSSTTTIWNSKISKYW
jgi:ankyrin repeat protein